MPYDPQAAFSAVSTVPSTPNVFVMHSSVPFRIVQEFINFPKANPGKLTHGSQGIGTTPHLTGALVSKKLGIEMLHVPY